jgi:hypothetical protein
MRDQPRGQVVDEEGIHDVNMAAWSSPVDFSTRPQAKPGVLCITVEQEDPSLSSSSSDAKDKNTTPPKSVFRLFPGDFTEEEVRKTIQKVVSYYETPPISHTDPDDSSGDDDDDGGDDNENVYNVPDILYYGLLAFHNGEYDTRTFLSASSYQVSKSPTE